MKKFWQLIGISTYWVTVPGIWLILRRTLRCRVVIRHEDSIVVVKPWLGNGKWCLPGGGVHGGESAAEAVRRETYEEVGIKLNPADCHSHGSQLYRQNGLAFTYHLFAAALAEKSPTKRQNIEIFEAAWVPVNRLTPKTANQDVLDGIKTAK